MIAFCLPVGALAGFLAGLLGVGGGLVIVPALVLLLPALGVSADDLLPAALATSLASILPISLASSWSQMRRGAIAWGSVAWMGPGLVAGTAAASWLAIRVPGLWLRLFIVGYCLLAAITLWRERPASATAEAAAAPRGASLGLVGTAIGAVSAWVGIGGGSMTVPYLIHRGMAPARAVAVSSACGTLIAFSGLLAYSQLAPRQPMPQPSLGLVLWPLGLWIGLGALASTAPGVALSHRLPARRLRRVFGGFLCGVAVLVALRG